MTKTTKRFNKGDLVTLFGSWDNKGTVYYRHAIIYACGTKRMTLTCAFTGDELGRDFYPLSDYVMPRQSEEETVAYALQLAESFLVREHAHLQRCLTSSTCTGYLNAIQRNIDALHEPRVKHYIYGGE